MNYPRIMLAGVNSGVGKTTLVMGIMAALRRRGLNVQPFKTGPDYIDPSYHTLISGRVCRNLDTWMLPRDAILELFERQAILSDISIIEGVMGLYDGLKDSEEGSSAQLAKFTRSPVILIVDAGSMSRSAAAIVLGYREFDKGVDLRGVILNNIGSHSHYNSAKRAIKNRTGMPVLGCLPKDKKINLPERHLGLIPADEQAPFDYFIKRLAGLVERNIDVEKIIEISMDARSLPGHKDRIFVSEPVSDGVGIAIARDAAFNFYYEDNLDILTHYGADLIEFKPLSDKALPQGAHGLYIGGGFPELFAGKLSKNIRLKNDICSKAEDGMPIYAECGGLMYLAKELVDFKDRTFPMTGIFNVSVKMADRLKALGYVNIEVLKDNILSLKGSKAVGHLFHWSYIDDGHKRAAFAYRLNPALPTEGQGRGRKGGADGLAKWNVLASYAHLHFGSDARLAKNFIRCCREYRDNMHDK